MSRGRIPLEDGWSDVLHKAVRGQGLSVGILANRAGISGEEVQALLDARFDARTATAVATALGLHPSSLLALADGTYHPREIILPAGMEMFTSDWDSMKVHSCLAWDETTREAVAFDTGADATELLSFLQDHGLTLRLVLLTHGHGDHLFDMDRIVEKTAAEVWIGKGEGMEGATGLSTFVPGREFSLGSLTIGTRLTKGHSPGGVTYVIGGLAQPVAVVGDALFAGSIGGPNTSYADCLRTNREEILSLPPETILCPGHGPLTTVAHELNHNPFFAGK
jgi:hydroxyacylglutathione hydrolase